MKAKSKRDRQVNPRLSPETHEKIERIAHREDRAMGEVVRILVEWILPHLRESDTLTGLTRGMPGRLYSRRVSELTQDQLHNALDIIFERAPSAVIEEIGRRLTEFAGKYGDEK